ncbi:SDR family NAD(P)-dependent oxidoreductase [Asticcacaulis solisilvae]|uniref:SDR family NAD(P)-dependent oxidoreductase n=1 Tax=Asticcacaulis solisilvae TaxID=1217274 RepID=UPI003FD7A5E5
MNDLTDVPVTLIGASRGLGRVLAETFHALGADVLVVARGQQGLDAIARDLPGVKTLACDATRPDAPDRVLAVQAPKILVLCGGAMTVNIAFPGLDWDAFNVSWETDTRISFNFLKAVLERPLSPGSVVVTMSSGAVVNGSPISGSYAGAKRMQMYLSSYAQKASDRAGLDLRFVSLAPARIMAETDLGAAAVRDYAAYNGTTEAGFLAAIGPAQTTRQVADAVLELVRDATNSGHFIVSAEGMAALS